MESVFHSWLKGTSPRDELVGIRGDLSFTDDFYPTKENESLSVCVVTLKLH